MPRKSKGAEPSLRDKLSAHFLEAFEADFEQHGADVIQKLRDKDPKAYAEIATRLIAASEPPSDGFSEAQSMDELGRKLLCSVGANELALTDAMIEQAVAAHDELVARLSQIAAGN